MAQKTVLIVGSGHLAYRLFKKFSLNEQKVIATNINTIVGNNTNVSMIENVANFIENLAYKQFDMLYLLEENDEKNVELLIAFTTLYADLPITTSLFNNNLIPFLQNANKNINVLNPAKIAAPSFVKQVYAQTNNKDEINTKKNVTTSNYKPSVIHFVLIIFIAILCTSIVFFHYKENLTWIDSIYFVIVTAASVGYGDINLLNSSNVSKIVAVGLIICSTISIWLLFSLTIDAFLKARIQQSLGIKKYNYNNHIIVCGLGRLGFLIAETLLLNKEKVIVIEQNEYANHTNYLKTIGAKIYIGDAKLSKVLQDANVTKAKALLAVINNDANNIEIGLNARTLNQNLNIILRIYDDNSAEKTKLFFDINTALSVSAIVDDVFYETCKSNLTKNG